MRERTLKDLKELEGLAIGEAAALLHVCHSLLRRWIRTGQIASLKLGPMHHDARGRDRRLTRIPVTELKRLVEVRPARQDKAAA